LGQLRAASVAQLHELFFKGHFLQGEGTPLSLRSTYSRVSTLQKHGYLKNYAITGTPHVVVHLTEKARLSFPRVAAAFGHTVRRPPTDDIAAWAFTRSSLWAALSADGFCVGRDLRAMMALRRNLVDRQRARLDVFSGPKLVLAERTLQELRASPMLSPLTFVTCTVCGRRGKIGVGNAKAPCPACGGALKDEVVLHPHECSACGYVGAKAEPHRHRASRMPCTGIMKERSYLPFDVAYKAEGTSYEVLLPVVDNPMRSIQKQLLELPLRFLGQPRLKVVLRPSDDDSVFDVDRGSFAIIGTRFRQLIRAFSPHENPSDFPYWKSAEVITYRPELSFRTVKKRIRHAS
jgi:hypothetical protein